MILTRASQSEIVAECTVCRRELVIPKSEVATESPEKITLRGNARCSCCALSDTISKTSVSHAETRSRLSGLHLLLSKKNALTAEQAEITEVLANNYPKYPILRRLARGGMFVGKFAVIALIVSAIAEAILFAVSGIMFLISKFFTQLDLFEMANNILIYPNKYFIGRGWNSFESTPFNFNTVTAQIKGSTDYLIKYLPHTLMGLFFTLLTLVIIVAIVREGIVLGFYAWHHIQRIRHSQAVKAYAPTGRQRLEQIEGELYDVNEQVDMSDILPANYLNTPAVETILNYFSDNRIDDLREAINLYNEERIKLEQSEILKNILAEIQSSKKYSKALYSFSINPYDHQVLDIDD